MSLTEIRNVWIEAMRQLDREICPHGGRTPSRNELITFVETLQFRLIERAEDNYKRFLKIYPNAAKPAPPQSDMSRPALDSRAEFQAWKQGMGK